MNRIKKLLKNERFKNILLSIILIFTLVYAFCCGFFIGTQKESIKQLDDYELVEKKDLNNKISKKSLVSSENNDYYAYLYLDFANEVYVKTDIYYSYSVDETNGDLLAVILTADYEYTDSYADYTYTNSYTYSVAPKINNNTDFINISNIENITFEFSLIRYQSSSYILPNIYIIISYAVDGSLIDLSLEGNAGFDESIIINNNYHWNDNNKRTFTIVDNSFYLFNLISDSYYNVGYSNGYDIGHDNGFQEGIDFQKDIYEETGTIFESIWDFLENAISTALSVFSIEILPGIPLSICIIIPLVFGIIFFIWKGGAQ